MSHGAPGFRLLPDIIAVGSDAIVLHPNLTPENMTNWKKMITDTLAENGETWADVQSHTLTEEQLNAEFDNGYGGTEGAPFTLWTANRVYFPICYDGAEWCGSVARNPNSKPTEHQGGG